MEVFELETEFMEYLKKTIGNTIENDIQEFPERFPYTVSFNNMLISLKKNNISFSEELMSEELFDKIVLEVIDDVNIGSTRINNEEG